MTWFKLDDNWLMHPKVQAVGVQSRALWIAGGLHCAAQLTDGRIEKHLVTVLAAQAGVSPRSSNRLIEMGLWRDEGDHYQMHHFLEYQPSRQEVEAERERWRKNKRKSRAPNPQRDSTENPPGVPEMSTEDSTEDSTENPQGSPRPPVPSRPIEENKGCTIAAACTTVAEPAAAQAEPALIGAAAAIVAERRRTATQALDKRNPAAWEASAMAGIRGDLIAVAAPGLDAEALADLVEPERPEPSPRTDPLDRTQAAARALANRDRSCERCHGSSVWLDDDGVAHECDHRAGAAA